MKVILVALFIFILNVPAIADVCFRTFEEDTSRSKIIFIGKLYKVSNDEFWHQGRPKTIFNFQIKQSYKGLSPYVGYISIVGPVGGCCNEHFQLDSNYIVFAYSDSEKSNFYWTNDCSNTGLISQFKDSFLTMLGRPVPVDSAAVIKGAAFINTNNLDEIQKNEFTKDSLQKTVLSLQSNLAINKKNNRLLAFGILLLIIGIIFLLFKIKRKYQKYT